jgi:eukaryotic-like serine/threonine-protein kinase
MTDHIEHQFGNYRLVRHLGRGAFSDVYLGIHVHLKTPAAIKLLHTELTSSDVEKFRNEARTIARLEHPHIVRVLDFGIENHTPFFVMIYAPNGTLRQRHPKGSIVPLATSISYVSQIADALQFAHDQKLIHRDIKPENMLLGRQNEVLLSDFGFVQIAQSSISQSTKEMAGTIPYMAPEQFQGKPRVASDQYALGIVVYEWLTGERPFQGSVLEIATQQMINPPRSVRGKNPQIPAEVEEVLFTALAKEPQQRFVTVRAFANAFQQASNIVSPIASTSTISFEEVSVLPDIRTQPISVAAPPSVVTQTPAPSFQTDTFEDSYANIDAFNNQPPTNVSDNSNSHTRHSLSRRVVLCGLAGVAIGSVISNGIWFAKSAGLFGEGSTISPLPPGTSLYNFTHHKGYVRTAAWSHDGYRIASGSADNTVQVWDAATGWHISTYTGHKNWVLSVAWSPDDQYITSGGGIYDKTVKVWDAKTMQTMHSFSEHTDGVTSVAWSPDGKYIASGSYDQTVQVWDAATGHEIFTLNHNNYVKSVAWSPEGKHIASSTGDSGGGGNGEHLVYVWDVNLSTKMRKLVYSYTGHNDEVTSVMWSPNGKRIASAGGNPNKDESDTSVQVWDASSGNQMLGYTKHHKIVNSVAWAPEGSRIASASDDMTVQVWQAE